jgi:hypothetical protein
MGVNAKRIPLVLSLLLAATGCGSEAMSAPTSPASIAPAADMAAAPPEAQESMQSTSSSSPTAPAPVASRANATTPPTSQTAAKTAAPDAKKDASAQSPDFLVMYTGDVAMSVDDGKIASTLDHIIDVSESVGGHLGTRRDQSVQVRVPSPRFREALAKITELGDVVHQSVSAEDVSEEFHDAEVRLANMRATQKRLQDFLAKSANMNDMLTLEHELERVSMEIDRVEGRMRYLREHVAFSTLTVALVARPKTQPIAGGGGGKIPATPARIMRIDAPWLAELGVAKLEN